jgi:hypothetical protein
VGLLLVAGCATAAQRQYQAISTNTQAVGAAAMACLRPIYESPEAAPLRPHIPLDVREATLRSLRTPRSRARQRSMPSMYCNPRQKACQRAFLDGLARSTPSIVPILADQYSKGDDDLLLLIQRKISWGEIVRSRRDSSLAVQAAMQAEGRRIAGTLEQQHAGELAQRQAALDAIARWAQTQQLINAMSRPVFTNCSQFGSMTNCVSQ